MIYQLLPVASEHFLRIKRKCFLGSICRKFYSRFKSWLKCVVCFKSLEDKDSSVGDKTILLVSWIGINIFKRFQYSFKVISQHSNANA